MDAQTFWTEIANCVRRVVRSNFQQEQATAGERVKLATAAVPLTDPLVQNYAVWRKSVLWIAAIALAVLTLIQCISFTSIATQIDAAPGSSPGATESILGKENIQTIDAVFIIILLSHVAGTILVFVSACMWHHLPRSKRLVRIAWLVMFLTPFLISALPLTSFLDWGRLPAERREAARMGLGGMFALGFFMIVGPKAISLFAGILRSSMTLKTLLPEAVTPGWGAVLVAPLYSLFLVVITTIIVQIQGNIWLVLGMICLMASPMVYVFNARHLLQPQSPDDMTRILRRLRTMALILNALGLIFIIVFVAVVGMFGFWEAVKFFLGILSSFMALTVVASDFMLALIWKGYEQARQFQGTPFQRDLDAKFDALSTVGLTKFLSGHVPPPPREVVGMPAPPPAGGAGPMTPVSVSLDSSVSLDDGPAAPGSPRTPPPPPPQ